MVRLFGIATGLVFALVALIAFVTGAYTWATEPAEESLEHAFHKHPKHLDLKTNGAFGSWDIAQLQRGYKVYSEVCSACHSMKFVAFRDLEQLGYNEEQIKAIAATKQVPGIDPNTGEATTRPGLPTDYFPSPYPNNVAAAAANNNAIPPDLSLMTKARHDGVNYVYSLLTGYTDPVGYKNKDGEVLPESARPGQNLYFNPYFANLNLAMAPPLTTTGQVTYDDGTEATIPQMAADVSAFMEWTAEPMLVKRKQTGFWWIIFLVFATVLAYLSKQQIWAAVKPKGAKKGPLQG
ncbi:cytochrome c1 [Alteriqipengyuania flavescens]|uniref:cytochrome c1 n=1 Tax=Alteriqipengyuania flavescens TaxID=3053610 RepID=UPI0025B43C51|nr:cytochrome c1 [Alteriqipengyuania flavescens]WJY19504.1 cytochrome c1 [Alteriqipengyuania flavescens]WJY25446.1 cytochrome c1 [Alteriqipengyuania flavescens]